MGRTRQIFNTRLSVLPKSLTELCTKERHAEGRHRAQGCPDGAGGRRPQAAAPPPQEPSRQSPLRQTRDTHSLWPQRTRGQEESWSCHASPALGPPPPIQGVVRPVRPDQAAPGHTQPQSWAAVASFKGQLQNLRLGLSLTLVKAQLRKEAEALRSPFQRGHEEGDSAELGEILAAEPGKALVRSSSLRKAPQRSPLHLPGRPPWASKGTGKAGAGRQLPGGHSTRDKASLSSDKSHRRCTNGGYSH